MRKQNKKTTSQATVQTEKKWYQRKGLSTIYGISLLFFLFFKCCDSDTIDDIKERDTPLTNKEIAGVYEGSYKDNDLGYTKAAKLQLMANGTFIANSYINGKESVENGLSPMTGKVEILFQKEQKKNEFGEINGMEYTHALNLHAKTKWGIRTSKYVFTEEMVLLPVQSYIDTDLTLKK